MGLNDPFGVKEVIEIDGKQITLFQLNKLEKQGLGKISRLPHTIKILLEAIVRQIDYKLVTEDDIKAILSWNPQKIPEKEVPFIPARILLQDLTGVPAIVDLAAMRSAMHRLNGNPREINPLIPADLVIDHSIQVDNFGTSDALRLNEKKEFDRNQERYILLRWAQKAFNNFRVVPPGKGIVHQINLEYLSSVVQLRKVGPQLLAFPDSLVGTDSHTTMINGLGVLGWGVGGIEAEAVLLGQPYYMPIPEVIGVKLTGKLNTNSTATDLVLKITQMLRAHGVVGKFVEFFGPGIKELSLADRATISNMCPEYGATVSYFPIDEETLKYLVQTGRGNLTELIKGYASLQGLFLTKNSLEPIYSETLLFDLSTIEPNLAGPKRPQDCISLKTMKKQFRSDLKEVFNKEIEIASTDKIKNGSIIIAAITSCTNTSNPSVLIGAGLLAKKAVEKGLRTKINVKTSLAPGSRVVIDYLRETKLLPYLEKLGFYLVGYGCTTCIGNSGPISKEIADRIKSDNLITASILSGNRNFEGRINPLTKANYLASPLLVVAYALAGTMDIDLINDPIGVGSDDKPIYLKDIWPSRDEISQYIKKIIPKMFEDEYSTIFEGNKLWKDLKIPEGDLYEWDLASTYIQEPPFFKDWSDEPPIMQNIKGAHILALLGNTITTDHISPAGAIPATDPAGKYLISQGITPENFNSFGSRRGNHEIMMRGTFGNIRLRNKLTPNQEGAWTKYIPTGQIMPIYDAAMQYMEKNIPLIVIAGKEYGTGSSRDWAAKGTYLLGIKAIIAESYERIHRSNLVGMGVLPLQFINGENAEKLGLTGQEIFDILGIVNMKPGCLLDIIARDQKGHKKLFKVKLRLDSPIEIEYYRNRGILHSVLRNMLEK